MVDDIIPDVEEDTGVSTLFDTATEVYVSMAIKSGYCDRHGPRLYSDSGLLDLSVGILQWEYSIYVTDIEFELSLIHI